MKNEIEKIEKEIDELDRAKRLKDGLTSKYLIDTLNKKFTKLETTLDEKLNRLIEKQYPKTITVNNQKDFPTEIAISNQKEFPKTIEVNNQKEFPKEIKIKNDSWLKKDNLNPILAKLIEIAIALSKFKWPESIKADLSGLNIRNGRLEVIPVDNTGRILRPGGGGGGSGGFVGEVDKDGNLNVNVQAGTITADFKGSTTITEYNIPCVAANTEYSQALPANTQKIQFKNRAVNEARWAFTTGKVAGSVSPYFTLEAGITHWEDGLDLTGKTIYFASDTAGDVIELIAWSF